MQRAPSSTGVEGDQVEEASNVRKTAGAVMDMDREVCVNSRVSEKKEERSKVTTRHTGREVKNRIMKTPTDSIPASEVPAERQDLE